MTYTDCITPRFDVRIYGALAEDRQKMLLTYLAIRSAEPSFEAALPLLKDAGLLALCIEEVEYIMLIRI